MTEQDVLHDLERAAERKEALAGRTSLDPGGPRLYYPFATMSVCPLTRRPAGKGTSGARSAMSSNGVPTELVTRTRGFVRLGVGGRLPSRVVGGPRRAAKVARLGRAACRPAHSIPPPKIVEGVGG